MSANSTETTYKKDQGRWRRRNRHARRELVGKGGVFKFSGALMCLCPAESKEIENVAAVWRGTNKEMKRSRVNKRECERGM